jgi:hypothetical protein
LGVNYLLTDVHYLSSDVNEHSSVARYLLPGVDMDFTFVYLQIVFVSRGIGFLDRGIHAANTWASLFIQKTNRLNFVATIRCYFGGAAGSFRRLSKNNKAIHEQDTFEPRKDVVERHVSTRATSA